MKKMYSNAEKQQGVALAISLIFLLVVTVISVVAAGNSTLGLKMSSNMQDVYRSFQEAEAGAYAALGLAGTGEDPFTRQERITDPFGDVTNHPLRNLAEDTDDVPVDVDVVLVEIDRTCPRSPTDRGGTSVSILDCDYYRIESEHDDPGKARTRVQLGVVKTVIGIR